MPAPAVKSLLPPAELRDRTEGWGEFGHINQYPDFRDTGVWPAEVIANDALDNEQPEVSDERDHGWWRADGLGKVMVEPD